MDLDLSSHIREIPSLVPFATVIPAYIDEFRYIMLYMEDSRIQGKLSPQGKWRMGLGRFGIPRPGAVAAALTSVG